MPRGAVALVAGTLSTAAVAGAAGCGTTPASLPAPPSPTASAIPAVLSATWDAYRERFIQADGRVIDPKRGGATTSEGQSYAMLCAAWMDDRDTFGLVWRWTQDNLRTADHLFAYEHERRGHHADAGAARLPAVRAEHR
jgi:endoglucanase